MTNYALTGLVKRRAELAGQIEATHAELRRMADALENLDQTIRQFDPGHNVEGIRPKAFRPPKDWGQQRRDVAAGPVYSPAGGRADDQSGYRR